MSLSPTGWGTYSFQMRSQRHNHNVGACWLIFYRVRLIVRTCLEKVANSSSSKDNFKSISIKFFSTWGIVRSSSTSFTHLFWMILSRATLEKNLVPSSNCPSVRESRSSSYSKRRITQTFSDCHSQTGKKIVNSLVV